MNQEYTYLWINFFTILFPFIFSFHPKIRFYRKWKFLFPSLFIVALFFIIWDMIFTGMGIWHFNEKLVTGIKFVNLPIEEVLFFFTIPYACVFLYEALTAVVKPEKVVTFGKIVFFAVIIFLAVAAFLYFDRLYTFVTYTLLIIYLIIIKYVLKVTFLHVALLAYVILLIPFFLVNGYLTGMFSDEAVVMYNNGENMGIRMITIPVEDTFYGLLLFLMNVTLFELLKKTLNKSH